MTDTRPPARSFSAAHSALHTHSHVAPALPLALTPPPRNRAQSTPKSQHAGKSGGPPIMDLLADLDAMLKDGPDEPAMPVVAPAAAPTTSPAPPATTPQPTAASQRPKPAPGTTTSGIPVPPRKSSVPMAPSSSLLTSLSPDAPTLASLLSHSTPILHAGSLSKLSLSRTTTALKWKTRHAVLHATTLYLFRSALAVDERLVSSLVLDRGSDAM
ncbi:hypothetical protein HK101_011249, partial [Irineochytrium annulatum]